MSAGPVAVIDIGSNSIKVLVAKRAPDSSVTALHHRTIDARISTGISRAQPILSEEGMSRALEAIRSLLADTVRHSPVRIALVATSAVRDAQNGDAFRTRVRAATGHEVRLLSGDEEANLIGRGLLCDPALAGLRDFYVFDLGGGSLECLAFRDRRIQQAVSLQLGCVRLTEKFVPDPSQPFPPATTRQLIAYVREMIAHGGFKFNLPTGAVAIGTGGTVTTVRAIIGARVGKSFEETDAMVSVAWLRELLLGLGEMPLARRKRVSGLPPARADVFPVALATFIAVADAGGFVAFENSIYNLRYGLAAELLGAP